MLQPRWRKVLADLWGNKTRTLLAILTIAVGVFAVGFVSNVAIIVMADMDADFQAANPHGAIIYCDPFDDDLLASLRRVPGVAQVEGRSELSARISTGPDKKLPVYVAAIPPLAELQVDRLRPNTPGVQLTLADHEVLIERSALSSLSVKPGDRITLELIDGRKRELRVANFVHDVNAAPVAFGAPVYTYVTPETMVWLGGDRQFTEVYLTVTDHRRDQAHVEAVAQAVAKKIEGSGRTVYFTQVYQPGRHFASDITQGAMLILSVLGGLAVVLSAFLVINTIMGLLAQHIRQIGVMKAVGARTWQIIAMYAVLVLSFGLLALAGAVPLAAVAGYGVAQFLAGFLNFDLAGFRIPTDTLLLQTAVALAVPLAAALFPVFNGTRITIREAISTYGLGKGHFGKSRLDRGVERIRFLARPLLISLRNTIRRKLRLALTLSTLTLGGAIFIAVFNLWGSFRLTLTEVQGYFLSDINLSFDRAQRLDKVTPMVLPLPGVTGVEGWGTAAAQLYARNDKKTATQVVFVAPPSNSTLIQPILTAGRWLVPADENAIVIGNHLLKERPDLKVGDTVVTKINQRDYTWHIVGIYKLVGNVSPPLVYTNYEYLSRLKNETEQIWELRVITASHDLATQTRIAKQLEAAFKQAGLTVTGLQTGEDWRQSQTMTVDVLIYFLLVMAVLIAVVGGLGLMGTMSLNVLERTREIGVIRAIGASNPAVLQLVMAEGLLIGFISWVLGALLSIPITSLLDTGVGLAVMTAPMTFTLGWDGLVIWLAGVLIIAALASALPAWNAMQLTVREVLAYE